MDLGFKVYFDSQDGSLEGDQYKFAKSGDIVSQPTIDPVEIGYEFEGWYKESECTNKWDFTNDKVNEYTTLYAKYIPQATGMTANVEAKTPLEKNKVNLLVTPEADVNCKVYYRVVDSAPSAMHVGDVITESDWTEVSDTNANEISVVNGKYIEIVEVTTDNKVTKWGKSNVTNDGYTPSYEIDLSPSGTLNFADETEGYSKVPEQSVTVTKSGNEDITNLHADLIGANSDDFQLSGLTQMTLDNTNITTTFSISPKEGLKAGTYKATVTVAADNGVSESLEVRFKVTSSNESDKMTTPASVKISGTEEVLNTLSAELKDKDGNTFTTDSAVTYEWYRLDDSNSSFTKEIGKNKTYDLTNDDLGKYIGLSATCFGKSFTAISGIIKGNRSNNNSGSSSKHRRNHDSTTTTTTDATTESDGNSEVKTTGIDKKAEPTGADQKSGTTGNGENKQTDGWIKTLGKNQYLKNGQPVTGWNQINDKWYLFDKEGTMQIGWKEINGIWYLLKDSGAMSTGWQMSNGTWYLLKDSGEMATGWKEINGIWYLLKDDGEMAIGWQMSNGEWYYLYSDGAMASNTKIDGYALGQNGAMN